MAKERNTKYSPFSCSNENVQIYKRNKTNDKDGDSSSLSISCDSKGRIVVKNGDEENKQPDGEQSQQHNTNQHKKKDEPENMQIKMSSENVPDDTDKHVISEPNVGEAVTVDKTDAIKEPQKHIGNTYKPVEKCKYPYYGKRFYCSGYGTEVSTYNKGRNVKPQLSSYGRNHYGNYNHYRYNYPKFGKFIPELKGKLKFAPMYKSSFNNNQRDDMEKTSGENNVNNSNTDKHKSSNFPYAKIKYSYKNPYFYKRVNHKTYSSSSYNKYNHTYGTLHKYGNSKDESSNSFKYYNKKFSRNWNYSHPNNYASALGKRTFNKSEIPKAEQTGKKKLSAASISNISNFLKGWAKPEEKDTGTSKKENNVVSIGNLYKYLFTNPENTNSKQRDVSNVQKEQTSSNAVDPLKSISNCVKPFEVLMYNNYDLGKENEKEIEKEKNKEIEKEKNKEKEKKQRVLKESIKERSKEKKKCTNAKIQSSDSSSSSSSDNSQVKEHSKFLFRDPFKGPIRGPADSFFKDKSNKSSNDKNEFSFVEPINYYQPNNRKNHVIHHFTKKENREDCLCPMQRGKKERDGEVEKPEQVKMQIFLHAKNSNEMSKIVKAVQDDGENTICNKMSNGNTNVQKNINEDENAHLNTMYRYQKGVHIKENYMKTGKRNGYPLKSARNIHTPKVPLRSVHSSAKGVNRWVANVTENEYEHIFKKRMSKNVTREKNFSEVKKTLNNNNVNNNNDNNNVNNNNKNNNDNNNNNNTQRNGNTTVTNDAENKNVEINPSDINLADAAKLEELVRDSVMDANVKAEVLNTFKQLKHMGCVHAKSFLNAIKDMTTKSKSNGDVIPKILMVTTLHSPNEYKIIKLSREDFENNNQTNNDNQNIHFIKLKENERFTLTNVLKALNRSEENETDEIENDSVSSFSDYSSSFSSSDSYSYNIFFKKKITKCVKEVEKELKEFENVHVNQCNCTHVNHLCKKPIIPNGDKNDLYHDKKQIVPKQKENNIPYNHTDEVTENNWVTEYLLEEAKKREEKEKEKKEEEEEEAKKREDEEKQKEKEEKEEKEAIPKEEGINRTNELNTIDVLNNAFDTYNSEYASPNNDDLNVAAAEDNDEIIFWNDLKRSIDELYHMHWNFEKTDEHSTFLVDGLPDHSNNIITKDVCDDKTNKDIFFDKSKEDLNQPKYEEMVEQACRDPSEKMDKVMSTKNEETERKDVDNITNLENINNYNLEKWPLKKKRSYENVPIYRVLNNIQNVQNPFLSMNNAPIYNTVVVNNITENLTSRENLLNVQTNLLNKDNCINNFDELQRLKQTMNDAIDVCVNGLGELKRNSFMCKHLERVKDIIPFELIDYRKVRQSVREMFYEQVADCIAKTRNGVMELNLTVNDMNSQNCDYARIKEKKLYSTLCDKENIEGVGANLYPNILISEFNRSSLLSRNLDELTRTQLQTHFLNNGEHGQAFSIKNITNYISPKTNRLTEVFENDIQLFDKGTMLETIKPYKGKRKALLVFLTYNDQLEGTKNDSLELCDILVETLNFENLILLNDCYTHYKNFISEEATKKNVLTALKNFILNSVHGDVLLFYFSGFSIKLIDTKFSEAHNFALLPQDYLKNNYIYSNEIFDILRKLGGGRQLCIILDTTYSSNFAPVVSAITFNKQMGTTELYKNSSFGTNKIKDFCSLRHYGKLRKKHVDSIYVEDLQIPFNPEQYYYTQQIVGAYGTFSIPSVFLFSADAEDRNAYELVVQGKVRGLLTYCIIKGISLLKRNFTYHDLFLVASNLLKHIKYEYQLKYVKFKLSFLNEHSPDDIKFLAHEFILKQNIEAPLWKYTLQMCNSGANRLKIMESRTADFLNNLELCNLVVYLKDIRIFYDSLINSEGTFFISCFVVNEEICTWERRRHNTACTLKTGDKLFFLQQLRFDKLDKNKENICIELFQRKNTNFFIGRTMLAIRENNGFFNLVDEDNSIVGVINVMMKKDE